MAYYDSSDPLTRTRFAGACSGCWSTLPSRITLGLRSVDQRPWQSQLDLGRGPSAYAETLAIRFTISISRSACAARRSRVTAFSRTRRRDKAWCRNMLRIVSQWPARSWQLEHADWVHDISSTTMQ